LLLALAAPIDIFASVPASASPTPTVFSAVEPAKARDTARQILDEDYQTMLPDEDQPIAAGQPPRPPPPPIERESSGSVGGAGSAVAQALMWVMIGVAILLLALFLASELRGWQADEASGDAATAVAPGEDHAAVIERPLGDADTLARSGKYGEAIHVLLLRTLEELVRRLDRPLPRSLTSREILTQVTLGLEARDALAHLVTAVEVSHFGGSEPGEGDYKLCVDRFQRFASAYTRGAARKS
jgi:hypothetical protein